VRAAKRALRRSLSTDADGPVSRLLNRPLSTRLSIVLAPLRPAPDLVSLVTFALGLVGAALQTLAAQHQLARALAGVATRQVDTAVSTVSTTLEAVETTIGEPVRRVEDLIEAAEAEPERVRERRQQPQATTGDPLKAESPRQDRRFDGRTYEERTLEELRERARELEIEGRSTMSKDELVAALRQHAK
jgi:hypothetical protein